MSENKPNLVKAADLAAGTETYNHPFNPNSEICGTHLSSITGLVRTGVSLVSVPVGKESFAYHSHHCEEEWLYILSGTGIAEIDGVEHEVSKGDFMGFPTPSVAHHLRNSGGEDLVYLMGGESRDTEIADFPKHGKRMVRRGATIEIYDVSSAQEFGSGDDT